MTTAEEYRAELAELQQRKQAAAELRQHAESSLERRRLDSRIYGYTEAIKSVKEQLDRLEPQKGKRRAGAKRGRALHADAFSFNFWERTSAVWSDLDGHTWTDVEQGDVFTQGDGVAQVQEWMAEASKDLTEKQALYLDAYYNDGKTVREIGEEYDVHYATVSRVIHNGIERLYRWVESKRAIETFTMENGAFDWDGFLRNCPALTPRQRQLTMLVFARRARSGADIARKLSVNQTTVHYTLRRSRNTLDRLDAPKPGKGDHMPTINNWPHATKEALAQQTGMTLGEYYRYCGEYVNGMTRYKYELWRRMVRGMSPEETAEELGLTLRTVRRNYRELRHLGEEAPT